MPCHRNHILQQVHQSPSATAIRLEPCKLSLGFSQGPLQLLGMMDLEDFCWGKP